MKYALVPLLWCPECHDSLTLSESRGSNGEAESGSLDCAGCQIRYPIVRFIPRFVPADNYAANFGFQWNHFKQTQLDSYSGLPISRDRFFQQSKWSPLELAGKRVLDVGCGAGRFAEIALSCGADLVALDYSAAVDACWTNLGTHPRLNVVQGDIYSLPFKAGAFDYVYCFGVLQHTPNVADAFLNLPRQLRPGGHLAVDVYPKLFINIFWSKYWLRPFTKHISQARLFNSVQFLVKLLLPLSRVMGRIPLVGGKLKYAIPVANYEGVFPLSNSQLREWAVLDTFDMLGAAHDHPQSARTLRKWLLDAGLEQVEVFRVGHLVGRGMKSSHGASG